MKTEKRKRYAVNAWRLLMRRDSRSVRRLKHWLRLYGCTPGPYPIQVPFDLACVATGTDMHRWDEPTVCVDLGDGVLVKDTPGHLREIGVIE